MVSTFGSQFSLSFPLSFFAVNGNTTGFPEAQEAKVRRKEGCPPSWWLKLTNFRKKKLTISFTRLDSGTEKLRIFVKTGP